MRFHIALMNCVLLSQGSGTKWTESLRVQAAGDHVADVDNKELVLPTRERSAHMPGSEKERGGKEKGCDCSPAQRAT